MPPASAAQSLLGLRSSPRRYSYSTQRRNAAPDEHLRLPRVWPDALQRDVPLEPIAEAASAAERPAWRSSCCVRRRAREGAAAARRGATTRREDARAAARHAGAGLAHWHRARGSGNGGTRGGGGRDLNGSAASKRGHRARRHARRVSQAGRTDRAGLPHAHLQQLGPQGPPVQLCRTRQGGGRAARGGCGRRGDLRSAAGDHGRVQDAPRRGQLPDGRLQPALVGQLEEVRHDAHG